MKPSSDLRTWSRRDVLKAVAAAGFVASLPGPLSAQLTRQKTSAERYLQSLARPDGGYAWHTDGRAHLTSTHAVVGSYRAIDKKPPRGEHLAEFIRTHHPARLKKLEQEHREFEYQQIQSLVWLGEDVTAFKEQVRGWTGPLAYLKQYERHGWPVFSHEMAAILCRALLGLPPSVAEREYLPYLQSRRRPDGSFNSSPTENGGGGHVMNTWWGLQALSVLGRLQERREETIAWVRACQLPDGAFTWQPEPDLAGVGNGSYTWAAVNALALLGAAPNDHTRCIDFLHSLRNGDGGFGDRPGWLSTPCAKTNCYPAGL